MKKWLLAVALMLLFAGAAAEEARYEAVLCRDTYLYAEPSGMHLAKIPDRTAVQVTEAGEEWCRILYDGQSGYCRTDFLYHFRSLDPFRYEVPGKTDVTGFAVFHEPGFISGGDFEGTMAGQRQFICVQAGEGETYRVPVWRGETAMHRTEAAYYPFAAWEHARPGDVIGGFTTFYGEQQGKGMAMEREYNIALGCERIHDTVLDPDEVFSFNGLCGPYTKGNGYRYAPNISNDGFGYGGGVCQVTTTLYNAVLTLPLQVEEWSVHRYSGIRYVPQFFDAAVGTYSDFTFRNTLPYAIRLLALPRDGVLTVLILRQ